MKAALFAVAVLVGGLCQTAAAAGEDMTTTIRDHRFEPAEIVVPAGQKFKLLVTNQDATPEEFESRALDIEKLIPGGATATITIGPLDPGRYDFGGEFHEDSAKGAIVAK